MTGKIDHVGIMVKDIDASIRFYTEVAGLKVKDRNVHAGGLEVAFLGYGLDDETVIEMIQGLKDHLPSEGIIHHVAFSVDNIEDEWNRIKQPSLTQIRRRWRGGWSMGVRTIAYMLLFGLVKPRLCLL